MLTFEDIDEEIGHYTYRPNWTMTVHLRSEGILLHIRAEVRNSYNIAESVVLKINSWLPEFDNRAQFSRWLKWRLCLIEIHECQEWFKRDGVAVYDPHKSIDPTDDEIVKSLKRRTRGKAQEPVPTQVFTVQKSNPERKSS